MRPIYRNLQHVPKIYGLTFLKFFGVLFISLFVMVGLLQMAGPVVAFSTAGLVLAILYSAAFWWDSRDPDRINTAFVRPSLTSYSLSNQRIAIK